MILRPSVIFGSDDTFFNRFGAMARLLPVLPVVGAGTKLQPVYVDDVAAAAAAAVTGPVAAGVYELGGPEIATFRQLKSELMRRSFCLRHEGGTPPQLLKALFTERAGQPSAGFGDVAIGDCELQQAILAIDKEADAKRDFTKTTAAA